MSEDEEKLQRGTGSKRNINDEVVTPFLTTVTDSWERRRWTLGREAGALRSKPAKGVLSMPSRMGTATDCYSQQQQNMFFSQGPSPR